MFIFRSDAKEKEEIRIFYRKLFRLGIPMALQMLMAALVGASDTLMLGFLNQGSLSAVSLATQVTFVLSLFTTAVTIGETVLAAQYWGKSDRDAVEQVVAISMKFSVLVSVLFFLAAMFVPGMLMKIFTSDRELIMLGSSYLRIVSWSYLFSGISQVYLTAMKNTDRVMKSTLYSSLAVVLNIILNAVFIFGFYGIPAMGIKGAAIATTTAKGIELVLCMAENRKKEQVHIRLPYLVSSDKVLTLDFYRYTSLVLANEIVWGCGVAMFSVILGHMGSDAVAANSAASILKNLIICLCIGVGNGSGIIVGNELGRGETGLAKKYGSYLCRTALLLGIGSGLVLLALRPLVLMYFSASLTACARDYLSSMLLISAYYVLGNSINHTVVSGIFTAGGDTRFGFICDAVNMWVFIIPIGLLAAFVFKLPVMAVYFWLNLDEFLKMPIEYIHYKKYKWVKNLTVENVQQ